MIRFDDEEVGIPWLIHSFLAAIYLSIAYKGSGQTELLRAFGPSGLTGSSF